MRKKAGEHSLVGLDMGSGSSHWTDSVTHDEEEVLHWPHRILGQVHKVLGVGGVALHRALPRVLGPAIHGPHASAGPAVVW